MPVGALGIDTRPALEIALSAGDLISPIVETAIDGLIGGMIGICSGV